MAKLALALLSVFFTITQAVPWGGPVETPAPVLDERHDRPDFAAISTMNIGVHAGVFQPTNAYPVNYCGWVNGKSDRATGCASKSSCIMNTNHGALGCCAPSKTDCAVYTACVDPEGEKAPEDKKDILTCQGKDRCYRNYNWFNLTMWACGKTEDAGTIYSNFTSMPKGKTLQIIITGSGGTEAQTTEGTQTAETASAEPTDSDNESNTATAAGESTAGPSSSATPSDSGSHKKKSNAGAIAGGVVGGLAALALIIAAILLMVRRSKKKKAEPPMAELESPKPTPVDFHPISSVTTPQPTTPGTPGAFSRPESSIVPPPGHHHSDPPVELP